MKEFKYIGVYLSHSVKTQKSLSRAGILRVSVLREQGPSICPLFSGVLFIAVQQFYHRLDSLEPPPLVSYSFCGSGVSG